MLTWAAAGRAAIPPSVLGLLWRTSPGAAVAATAVGTVNGVLGVVLLSSVARGLTDDGVSWAWAGQALGLVALLACATYATGMLTGGLALAAANWLRVHLFGRVADSDIGSVEKVGGAGLSTVLTEDIGTATDGLSLVPAMLTNVFTVCACLVYIGMQSLLAVAVVLGFVAAGAGAFTVLARHAGAAANRARDVFDEVALSLEACVLGHKALKLDRSRRQGLGAGMVESLDALRRERTTVQSCFALAEALARSLFFLLLVGVPVVIAEGEGLPVQETVTIAISIFYLMAPLSMLVGNTRELAEANTALNRLRTLPLGAEEIAEEVGEAAAAAPPAAPAPSVPRVDLDGLTYERRESADVFRLGPVSLSLRAGEICFLTGGNGSGKSTLLKLLTGLYRPSAGDIRLGGEPVAPGDVARYRHLFAASWAEEYVFPRIFPLPESRCSDEWLHALMAELDVGCLLDLPSATVRSRDAASTGERKRMALLQALVLAEQRPFIVLDEPVAHQAPAFKQRFYDGLLPALKEKGKGIIVATHDADFFGRADRLLRMRDGRFAPC